MKSEEPKSISNTSEDLPIAEFISLGLVMPAMLVAHVLMGCAIEHQLTHGSQQDRMIVVGAFVFSLPSSFIAWYFERNKLAIFLAWLPLVGFAAFIALLLVAVMLMSKAVQ